MSDSTVTPGQQVTVSGDGFMPNQTLRITFSTGSVSMGTTTSNTTGRFSAPVRIPTTAPAGTHRIVVAGTGATGTPREAAASVTVNLATTGRMTAPLAVAGLAALLLGARALRYAQWSRPVSTVGWTPPPRQRTIRFRSGSWRRGHR